MRIVIDLQGAQSTGSRNRGIGRYSVSLCKALLRNRGEHEIILAVSDLFPDTVELVRSSFEALVPQQNIRVWTANAPVSCMSPANDWRRGAAQLTREAFFASLEPDFVLVTSLFEGLGDDAVTSVGMLADGPPTAVVLFDLIPLIYRSPYLDNPDVSKWYLDKIEHLKRADLCLAISESSRDEGRQHLDLPDECCVSISTDAEPHFRPITIPAGHECELRARYGLDRPFLMYTGGIDYRKNIEGLISAYAALPFALRGEHKLAIVCSVQDAEKERLEALAVEAGLMPGEVVMTGFVPEDDLLALYNLCSAFVFPSWHEGFGLPVLEAMRCGVPVIGADRSSIPEVIGLDEALFDPHSRKAMTAAIERVLTDDNFRSRLRLHGKLQAEQFSWDQSARKAIAAMEQFEKRRRQAEPRRELKKLNRRPRLAFVSPLPPARSGIADYSAELLRVLSEHYRIDVIVEQEEVADKWIRRNFAIRSPEWLKTQARRYERVLYHFGNSHFHQHMFDLLEAVPGVVVLHDFFLSGVVSYMDATNKAPSKLPQALYKSHGYFALSRRLTLNDDREIARLYPCNTDVIRNSVGVIVHSPSTQKLSRVWYGDISPEWAIVPHLRSVAGRSDKRATRRMLGFDENDVVICSFGMLAPTKQSLRLAKIWNESSLSKDPRCHLVFVGENEGGSYGAAIQAEVARNMAEFKSNISITGWTDTTLFERYLGSADIAVQLRTFSRGETSGAILDCMKHGLASVVNANGSMADLDPTAVWKLPDLFTDGELVEALERLRADSTLRNKFGAAARDIIRTEHDPIECAAQYAEAIERFYASDKTGWKAIPEAVNALLEPEGDGTQWSRLAKAIGETFPSQPRAKQLLIDVSGIVSSVSEVDPIVEAILTQWLTTETPGTRVEPVYEDHNGEYRYARQFTFRLLGHPDARLPDSLIEFGSGDIFFGLAGSSQSGHPLNPSLSKLRRHNIALLMAIRYKQDELQNDTAVGKDIGCKRWLPLVSEVDGVICFTEEVSADLRSCLQKANIAFSGDRIKTLKYDDTNREVISNFSNTDEVLEMLSCVRVQISALSGLH